MFQAFPGSDLAVFNGGSVRVDDVLEGPITQYDIVRILPFGGGISQVNMTGEFLRKVLEAGLSSVGVRAVFCTTPMPATTILHEPGTLPSGHSTRLVRIKSYYPISCSRVRSLA